MNYMSAATIPMAHISIPSKGNKSRDGSLTPSNVSNNTPSRNNSAISSVGGTGDQGVSVNNGNAVNSTNAINNENTINKANPSNKNGNGHHVSEELFKLREKVDFLESNLRGSGQIQSLPPQNQQCQTQQKQQQQQQQQQAKKTMEMSFYDTNEPILIRAGRLIASGPLSFASVITRDPFLRVSLLKIRKEKNTLSPLRHKNLTTSDLVRQLIIDDPDKEGKNEHIDKAFKTRLIENEGLDEVKLTNRTETQPFSSIDYETQTIKKIQEILPEEKLIWLLVDKFFTSILAGFIPFVTEEKLRERIKDIINTDPITGRHDVKINKRFDFAYMGMLLIIMRLTFLSVIPTVTNSIEEQYILSKPIGLNFINVAQMCLNQFRLLRRGALPVLQCSLFMRLYHKYAPEDGDGSDGGDSEVFLGMLLQMGNSIGLNRDMKHSEPLKNDFRLHNLWRMVWHEIVSLDLYQSLTMGNPVLINTNCYDTELPKLEEAMEYHNIVNVEIWKAVVHNFQMNDLINELVRDILDDILNLKKLCNLTELLPKIEKLEQFIDVNFVGIEWILDLPNASVYDGIIKTYKFKFYIELKTSLYIIYYHIYLRNSDFETLHKMFKISMEILPLNIFLTSMNNGKTNYFDSIFGFGAQLILVPTILVAVQKLNQLVIAFTSRTLDYKYSYPKTQPRSQLIKQLRDELFLKFRDARDTFYSLSSIYYHSWRISKSHNLIYNLLKNEQNNLWDKESPMNRESRDVKLEVNHFKAIPNYNELTTMSINEIESILTLVKNGQYETILRNKLKNKAKSMSGATKSEINVNNLTAKTPGPGPGSGSGGDSGPGPVPASSSSTGSTPTNSTIHMKNTELSNIEIDKLWFQMMSNNPGQPSSNVLPGNEDLLLDDDQYAMLDFDKLMGDTSPYDMFGDIPFYHER